MPQLSDDPTASPDAAAFAWLSPVDAAHLAAVAADVELEAAVDALAAADAAVAAAAARRLRAIAAVHAASLRSDAEHAVLHDTIRRRRPIGALAADAAAPDAASGDPARAPRAVRATDLAQRSARAEVAMTLGLSERAAADLVDAADLATRHHPSIATAMRTGAIRERHAMRLLRAVAGMPRPGGSESTPERAAEPAARVVAAALPAADSSLAAFGRLVDRLVRRANPTTQEVAHAAAIEARTVWVTPDVDGMAVLSALLPAVDAHAIHDRLTGIAVALERDPANDRGRGQLRADALRDLLIDGETDSLPAAARGIRPTVHITVPALAVATDSRIGGEAEVDGVGPIDLDTATRLIGAASEWTRIVTHPVTALAITVDRTRYRPPASIARLARWMHTTCTFPGCRTPAHRCELDHIVDWHHGGTTGIENLHPVCTGHHTLKHATRWRAESDAGGRVRWTSPAGRVAVSSPERALAEPPPF